MYGFLVPLVGGLLTIQNSLNSVLAARVGNYLSLIVIHLSGFIPLCAIVLLRKEKGSGERLPFASYLGGFVGVGTVLCCNLAYGNLGASLAVALALVGQTVGSVLVDATGFLGRRKYPLSARSLPGIALAALGVVVIAGSWEGKALYMVMAFASGALPAISFTMNSQVGLSRGVFKATWLNYAVGLVTTLVVIAIARPPLASDAAGLADTGLVFIVGGGLLGVVFVAATSFIFPKIPALWTTLLLFTGQALTGVVVDAIAQGSFSARKLVGTLIVLAGMCANAALDARKERAPAAA